VAGKNVITRIWRAVRDSRSAPRALSPVPEGDRCPCNSGVKHGECCQPHEDRQWFLLNLPEGLQVHLRRPAIKSSLITKSAPPFAEFLINSVARAVVAANGPEAAECEGLNALVLTATALEGVVNRLLEPLTEPAKWEGRKGVEGYALRKKWLVLYSELKLKPGLASRRVCLNRSIS
jgi:hypothetical protein